jgi:hypothetical protein
MTPVDELLLAFWKDGLMQKPEALLQAASPARLAEVMRQCEKDGEGPDAEPREAPGMPRYCSKDDDLSYPLTSPVDAMLFLLWKGAYLSKAQALQRSHDPQELAAAMSHIEIKMKGREFKL